MANDCENLREISSAFMGMRNLEKLCLNKCYKLAKIESLEGLDSLQQFEIDYCVSLRKLPKLRGSKNLRGLFFGMRTYLFSNEVYLSEIEGLDGLYSLQNLIIEECHLLRIIPNLLDSKNLVCMKIHKCHLLSEIESLEDLDSLEELSISHCRSLRRIQLPKKLKILDIHYCWMLSEIEGLENLESLTKFDLQNCESIIRLPNLLKLKKLEHLSMCDITMRLQIGCLEGLESLEARRKSRGSQCWQLWSAKKAEVTPPAPVQLANIIGELIRRGGQRGNISDSVALFLYPRSELAKIEYQDLSNLTKLQELHIKECKKLTEILGVDRLEILEILSIDGCISIETLPNLSNLKNLKTIIALGCKKLTESQAATCEVQGVVAKYRLPPSLKYRIRGIRSFESPLFQPKKKNSSHVKPSGVVVKQTVGVDREVTSEKLDVCL
ncbi:uncharacterized protein LOC122084966 [Macadamia integrifolia]|uniref:uncharacterized protein LOC122084966 n=1 Tax=Macadamia integrifolia TaxID=60698 RepID=UPI001C4F2445|nr:uncharacterized protein LOC122084966 [Macadamia integrifolia]